MNILVTICGRAGSKGVKGKNVRPLCGIPLVYYTLSAALHFKELHPQHNVDLCVDSDSDELLRIAESTGLAKPVRRPAELAGDSSPKLAAIIHAVSDMERQTGAGYDFVIDLDITSPLREARDIAGALEKLADHAEADVVFSVVPARRNPYFNMVEAGKGRPRKVIDSEYVTRQQAPEIYDMNASIYCYRRDALGTRIVKSPFDGRFDITLMRDTAVLDIDSEEDFELMEVLASHFFERELSELYGRTSELFKSGR